MTNYSAELSVLRFWNRVAIGSLVIVIPAVFLVAFFVDGTLLGGVLPLFVFALGVAVFVVAYFRMRTFRCPRCGNYFTVKHALASNTRGRRCVHCGLEAYGAQQIAPTDAASGAAER